MEVVKDLNERILTGVATKYGKNSTQYEMAEAKRKASAKRLLKKQNNSFVINNPFWYL